MRVRNKKGKQARLSPLSSIGTGWAKPRKCINTTRPTAGFTQAYLLIEEAHPLVLRWAKRNGPSIRPAQRGEEASQLRSDRFRNANVPAQVLHDIAVLLAGRLRAALQHG